MSTSFSQPYNVARQIASLDHISRGRAGWNIVTSAWGGENFGIELPRTTSGTPSRRSSRASSRRSGTAGRRARSSATPSATCSSTPPRCTAINWESEHFRVAGPLGVPRSPQGRPIIAQAGTSPAGKAFGARHADVIFTTGLTDLRESQDVYDDLRKHVVNAGRDADSVKVLPGVAPVIGSTDAEARRIWEDSHDDLDLERGLAALTKQFGGVDLSGYDPDAPIPLADLPPEEAIEGRRSRYGVLRRIIESGRRHHGPGPGPVPRQRRRPLVPHRLGRERRRPAAGALGVRRRRRLQLPAVLPELPRWSRGAHRAPRPRAAAARALPHRLRGRHAARQPRSSGGHLMSITIPAVTPHTAPEVRADRPRSVRWELAAALRTFARDGYEFGFNGHVSARAPEAPGHYWVNPVGISAATITPGTSSWSTTTATSSVRRPAPSTGSPAT